MAQQETQGGKILPAFFVDPIDLGATFPSGEWPLHMTYFPPIAARFTPGHAIDLRRRVNPMKPFLATAGEAAVFGPNHDIPVRRIRKTKELMVVHRALVATFGGLPHNPQYRMPYEPHVSIAADDTRLERHDSIEVGGFSIVEKSAITETWKVIAKIGLKGEAMKTDARIIKASERLQ